MSSTDPSVLPKVNKLIPGFIFSVHKQVLSSHCGCLMEDEMLYSWSKDFSHGWFILDEEKSGYVAERLASPAIDDQNVTQVRDELSVEAPWCLVGGGKALAKWRPTVEAMTLVHYERSNIRPDRPHSKKRRAGKLPTSVGKKMTRMRGS